MGYVKMACPSCGAAIENSDDRDFFFCSFCGTKIVKDMQFVELSGSISISGVASTETLLERAFLFLEDRNFKDAASYFEKILDMAPKCSKAYMGKLMCQLQVSVPGELANGTIPLTRYDHYEKALRFATPSEAAELQGYNEAILQKISAKRQTLLNEIAALRQQIAADTGYLVQGEAAYKHCATKKILWKVVLIFSIINAVFWVIGAFAVPVILVITIPNIALMVLMFMMNNRAKKSTNWYDTVKERLEKTKKTLAEKENFYQQWEVQFGAFAK